MQASLFDFGVPAFDAHLPGVARIDLGQGAWVDYLPHWLSGHETLYRQLADGADWKQGRRLMYHRTVNVPRLTAVAPDTGPGAPLLSAMASTLAHHYGVVFAGITLAWYRDGKDSVAPHGDRIGRLCEDTVIAIVSVGAPRRFLLHPAASGRSRVFSLGWGDLLVMGGSCQRTWLHSVPKVMRADPRISIQFRAMEGVDANPAVRYEHVRKHTREKNGARLRGADVTLRDAATVPGAAHYR